MARMWFWARTTNANDEPRDKCVYESNAVTFDQYIIKTEMCADDNN